MPRPPLESDAPCVLLVEDSNELAKAMMRTLRARGFAVLHARSYAHASALIEREDLQFDAAVLDHQLPDGDSRELVTALANRSPSCCSLVLTGHDGNELARDYLQRGAFRYASKPIKSSELVILVSGTVNHTQLWRSAMAETPALQDAPPPAVVPDFEHAAKRLQHVAGLSDPETRVAYWMLQGLRDAEIGEKLGQSERTAKRHVSQVLSKLSIKNRGSLWAVLGQDAASQGDPDGRNAGNPVSITSTGAALPTRLADDSRIDREM